MCKIHKNNPRDCFRNFTELEFPKDDNKILKYSAKILKQKIKCDFILLKILMVRLRRSSSKEDWKLFKVILNKNLNTILESEENYLNIRWIISILETFIDFGDDTESRNALIAVSFHRNEKFFSTFLDFFEISVKTTYEHDQSRYIIGMPLNDKTDLPQKYFERVRDKMTKTPIIFDLFKKMMSYLIRNEETLFHILSNKGQDKNFKIPAQTLLT
jgi:hypothetical protein